MSDYHFTVSITLPENDYEDKDTARRLLKGFFDFLGNHHADMGMEFTLIDDEDFIEYMKQYARIQHG